MKVILTQDVSKLGASGDLVEASDGYARNFLFPRKLAEEATPERMKEWKEKEASKKKKEARLEKEAREFQKILSGRAVKIKASTGEKGRLFGSVTAANVAESIAAQLSVRVEKKSLRMPEMVKQVGSYQFSVRLYPGIEAEMTLIVEGE
jgi:large subunit ribosomal protein L9